MQATLMHFQILSSRFGNKPTPMPPTPTITTKRTRTAPTTA